MNRTKDGRIIDKRVIIDKEILRKIILNIKEKNKFTWKDFASRFNVCEQTIRNDWIKKGNKIPLGIFNDLIKLHGAYNNKIKTVEPFWGQKLENGESKKVDIKIPNKESEEFAEFYGIMLGDGCLFSSLKGFSITGDSILDNNYLRVYIKNLIYHLFGIIPHYYPHKDSRGLNCIVYNKNAVEYISKLGFPIGLKKEISIPKFILGNKKRLANCIKGIMDTDGSLSAHPNTKIMIHLSITSKSLREDVSKGLKRLGIHFSKFNKGIMIYGKEVKKFYSLIGFSNYKNSFKYSKFLETGIVPKSKEVEIFIIGQ